MSKNYVATLLNSEDLKVFWNDVKRQREGALKKLINDEDVSYAKVVKALDRVLELPNTYKNSVDTNNSNKV